VQIGEGEKRINCASSGGWEGRRGLGTREGKTNNLDELGKGKGRSSRVQDGRGLEGGEKRGKNQSDKGGAGHEREGVGKGEKT